MRACSQCVLGIILLVYPTTKTLFETPYSPIFSLVSSSSAVGLAILTKVPCHATTKDARPSVDAISYRGGYGVVACPPAPELQATAGGETPRTSSRCSMLRGKQWPEKSLLSGGYGVVVTQGPVEPLSRVRTPIATPWRSRAMTVTLNVTRGCHRSRGFWACLSRRPSVRGCAGWSPYLGFP